MGKGETGEKERKEKEIEEERGKNSDATKKIACCFYS